MTRQVVTTTPHNSGLGDPAFTAFEKVNANDAELYAAAGVTGASALSAATYAIARTLTGTTTGDCLKVLGRTTQSDGGQGLFTWVTGGTTTIDDGFELTATGGVWRRAGLFLLEAKMLGLASFTFATFPTLSQMTNMPKGIEAFATDTGLCVWNGAIWVVASLGATYAAGNTGTTPVPNLANGNVQTWTQNGNVTWGAPTNVPQVGQSLTLVVTQNGTGGYTTAWNAVYKNIPKTPTASVANAKSIYVFIWNGTYWSIPDNYSNTPFQYGAIGDGVTDDAVAVQAAANSGFCYLPAGFTFLVSSTITVPANGVFIGDGIGVSIIKGSSVAGPVVQAGTDINTQNLTIGNFQISGTAKIAFSGLSPLSNYFNIWASGTFTFDAFHFDVAPFGCSLSQLSTSNAVAIGSTLTFTASVGGATSGTILSGTNPGNGPYRMVFSNGETRKVTITGSACAWTTALAAGTITTVQYGAAFFCGGNFNTNACNELYSGGPYIPFDFVLEDLANLGSSSGSTFNCPVAQGGHIGLFAGYNHFAHTFNSFYSENTVKPIQLGSFADAFPSEAQGHTFNSMVADGPTTSHPFKANRVAIIDFNLALSCTFNSPTFYQSTTYDSWVPSLVFSGGGSPTSSAYGYLIINAAGVPKAAVLLYGGTGYGSNPTVALSGGSGGSGTSVTAVQAGGIVTTLTLTPGSGWTGNIRPVPVIYTVASNCQINNPYLQSNTNIKWPLYPMICQSAVAKAGSGIAVSGDNTWVQANQSGGFYDGSTATTTVAKTSGNNANHVATYMSDAASPVIAYSPNSAGTNKFIPTVFP